MARKTSFDMTADPAAFDEAVQEFAARRVVSRAEADTMDAYARKRAWWVSGVAQMDVVNDVHQSLIEAVRDGVPFEQWQKEIGPKLEAAWGKPNGWRLLTIYRNATTSAYNAARLDQMEQPHIVAVRPFKMLEVIDDERTCPICGQFIEPKVILPWDDPFWLWHSPQFHHACRCGIRSLRRKVAEKLGLTTSPVVLNVEIPEGWGLKANLAEPPKPSERKNPPDPDLQLEAAVKAGKDLRERKPTKIPDRLVAPNPLTGREIMHQQLAGPGGSNAGGVFLGADGKKRYVKLYDDRAQAAGEHLANKLYADLGLSSVKSFVFEHNGKLAYASEFIEGAVPIGVKGLTPELASKALDGLVGDLVVANWDAVGFELDNLVVTKAGDVIRIDNGGAFLMRAQAGRKPVAVLEKLPEWDGFFNRDINPSYSRVAGMAGATSPDEIVGRLEEQLAKLTALEKSAGGWGRYVRTHAPLLSESDSDAISSMLTQRTRLIGERVAEAKERVAINAAKRRRKRRNIAELDAEPLPKARHSLPGIKRPADMGDYEALNEIRLRSRGDMLDLATPDEIRALEVFTDEPYYTDIRAALSVSREEYLRGKHDLGYEVALEHGKNIDSLLAKRAKLKNPKRLEDDISEVFRGVRNLPQDVFDHLINQDEVTWNVPTSTSWDPETAVQFSSLTKGGEFYSVLYRVKPAAKTSGLAIEGVSFITSEHEVLFGNGVKFNVTKVVRDAAFPRRAVVYLEEV